MAIKHTHTLGKYDCKDTTLPSLIRGRELVSVTVNRTVMHNSRRMSLFFFRNLPDFMKPTTRGERTTLILPSHRAEQLCQRVQQRVVTTVEDSALRTEMKNLESDEEHTSRRVLWYKPTSWLGQIRTHHRDESWSAGL